MDKARFAAPDRAEPCAAASPKERGINERDEDG